MILTFDKQAAMERVDQDKELLVELIGIALDDGAQKIEILKDAVAKGNAKIIQETAHNIKSAFGNVGAMETHGLCYDLERLAKANNLLDAPHTLASLINAVEKFKKEVENF